jgi:purine-nucleoside/S-methyl-5'-thioadenosine phosphorylase / adenosine deaminase
VSTAPVLVHEPWTELAGLRHGFLPGRAEPDVAVHTARQVHGALVATLAPDGPRPDADGLATDRAGAFVGIVTADCVPLLLVAPRRRVVAAVHAGWRGAAAGVVEAALARLRDTFDIEPREIEAAIGPAIGACCYEVGPEVRAAFARTGETTACAWRRERARDHLDLRAAVAALLAAGGVRHVATLGPCTRCSPDYCSYRRDGDDAGRQVSFIGWA